MVCQCLRFVLIVIGIALLAAAILPVFEILPISDGLQTALISATFLMLPAGAVCLAAAAALTARVHRG